MKIYQFTNENGKKITQFNSDFTMSRVMQTELPTHVGYMHLGEKGIVGFHQAVVPQLLLITGGEGFVRGELEEYFPVQAGDAVFWEKDEWHETKTDSGLTAIVLESEGLDPSHFMAKEK